MSKRSNPVKQNSNSDSNKKGKVAKNVGEKGESYSWGTPGCYLKFLEECKNEKKNYGNEKGNVFNSGKCKDRIAARMNLVYPGCDREKIRTKLRQNSVIDDLGDLDITSMFVVFDSFFIFCSFFIS